MPQNSPPKMYGNLTGINRLIDLIANQLPAQKFPTAGRVFLESVQGNKAPITESDLSADELNTLRRLVDMSGNRGYVTYDDYKRLQNKLAEEGDNKSIAAPSVLSLLSPIGNLQTTLGRFNYKDGYVTDAYDFNPINAPAMTGEVMAPFDFGYSFIRDYAGQKLPPGYGRNVKIKIK